MAPNKKHKDPVIKAFRTSSEVETFYRFVHENSLRHEAKVLLELIVEKIKKGLKKASKN